MNLAPVIDALLADARREAEGAVASADQEVAARLGRARAEAERARARARAEGEAQADAQLAAERARARRAAREIVLAAQQQALLELRRRVLARTVELRDELAYRELIERLRALVRDQLGADASITNEPEGAPGVIGEHGDRRVDYRLASIAARCLDELGTEIESLWK